MVYALDNSTISSLVSRLEHRILGIQNSRIFVGVVGHRHGDDVSPWVREEKLADVCGGGRHRGFLMDSDIDVVRPFRSETGENGLEFGDAVRGRREGASEEGGAVSALRVSCKE